MRRRVTSLTVIDSPIIVITRDAHAFPPVTLSAEVISRGFTKCPCPAISPSPQRVFTQVWGPTLQYPLWSGVRELPTEPWGDNLVWLVDYLDNVRYCIVLTNFPLKPA